MILNEVRNSQEMFDVGYPLSDLFLTTTNSTIKMYGSKPKLVMGKGHAKQVLDKNVGIDELFASVVMKRCAEYRLGKREQGEIRCYFPAYGLIAGKKLGLLQTKDWFYRNSDISMVEFSLSRLYAYAVKNWNKRIDLPFPAIGNGGLSVLEVMPLVKKLPDNCVVWKLVDMQTKMKF